MQTIIFTDGSSLGNPGPGGWGAIIVYNDDKLKVESLKLKVQEFGGRVEHTTNNRMELSAAIEALSFLSSYRLKTIDYRLTLYTDSSYVINGITKWISGWKKNGWVTKDKKEVLNRDLWEMLGELTETTNIEWKYVGGHVGVRGNERCDEIATKFAEGEKVDLYKGVIENYLVPNILDITFDESMAIEKSKLKTRSAVPAFSYVSKVLGKIETHKTWKECEARVKGVSGAKYKKALSESDERKIIDEWK